MIQDLSSDENLRTQAQSRIDTHFWEDFIQRYKQVIHAVETELKAIAAAAAEKEGK